MAAIWRCFTLLYFFLLMGYFSPEYYLFQVEGESIPGSPAPSINPSLDLEVENYTFKAEVTRLMDLIINNLYTQKDRFMRELISNAVDALEKIRLKSIGQLDILGDVTDFEVRIKVDNDNKTIIIRDTGIGMTKQDLINNLGTVAKSGTTNFLEAMAKTGDVNLIGQFGVGFYSAFLVADKVTVISKHLDDDQYVWESSADASFIVKKDPSGNTLGRGTEIFLQLKAEATDFLNAEKLIEISQRFSQFMSYPIYIEVDREKEVEDEVKPIEDVPAKEGEDETAVEVSEEDEDTIDEEKKGKKTVLVKTWELINKQKPIWLRPKSEITEQDYIDFYTTITRDSSPPLAWTHFVAEGEIEFRSILYIPAKAPVDVFDNYFSKQTNLKLYVRRVLVADQFDDLLPRYLSFVKGVVDSDDVPLNVAREQLQETKILRLISKKLIRKFIELVRKIATDHDKHVEEVKEKIAEATDDDEKKALEEKLKTPTLFDKLWGQYSRHLKLVCFEDEVNREKVAKVLRFATSNDDLEYTTLDGYISRMSDSQKNIYYAAGDDAKQLKNLPQMQMFAKKGFEVLLLIDTTDEPIMQKLTSYNGKKLVSIQKGDAELDETETEKKRQKKLAHMYAPLLKWFTSLLREKVLKVEVSKRLVVDPCAIVSSSWGYSAHMERIIKSQTFADKEQLKMMSGMKVLEINPNHPLIINLLGKVKSNPESPEVKELGHVLYDTAMLASGFEVEDSSSVAATLYRLLAKENGVDSAGPFEEIEVDVLNAEDDESAEDSDEDFTGFNEPSVETEAKNLSEASTDALEKEETEEPLADASNDEL